MEFKKCTIAEELYTLPESGDPNDSLLVQVKQKEGIT